MKVFGVYRPRLRTSLKYRVKPFLTFSLLLVLFFAFQNFGVVSPTEGFPDRPLKTNEKLIILNKISEAHAYETSEGLFNIIKGGLIEKRETEKMGKTVEIDYLHSLDVSGKNCMRMAEAAVQTGQSLLLTGVPADSRSEKILILQKVLDCKLEPVNRTTALAF